MFTNTRHVKYRSKLEYIEINKDVQQFLYFLQFISSLPFFRIHATSKRIGFITFDI